MADNKTRLRWQREALAQVSDFVDAADVLGLPAITWIIATTGAVTGRVDGLGRTPDEQRGAVHAWSRYLQLPVAEHPLRDGSVTLIVRFKTERMVGGVIRADIAPLMDDEAGA
jgi:hypothetical protein